MNTGDRLARASLRCLVGTLIAIVVFVVWQFEMQTSAGYNPAERVVGWSAVLRELPVYALMLTPLVLGLVFGVRSARLRSRRGVIAIWLQGAAALAVVDFIASDVEDSIRNNGGSITSFWVALVVTAVALVASLLSGRLRSDTGAGVDEAGVGRANRSRRALTVWLGGLTAAFLWLLVAQLVLSSIASGFTRSALPGSVTITAAHASTYFIYGEGNAPNTLAEMGAVVSDPAGQHVATTSVATRAEYLRGLRGGRVVGSFEATTPGSYRISAGANLPPVDAPYAPANPNGDFAVGRGLSGWMRPSELGVGVLLVVSLVASIMVLERARRRLHG